MSIIRKDLGPRPPARLKSKLSVVRPGRAVPDIRLELKSGGEFSIYSAAPDELENAIDQLARQAIEPNAFQSAPFVLPGLGESHQQLRLALIGDGFSQNAEARLSALMAFRVAGQGSHILTHSLILDETGYTAPLIARQRPMAVIDQLFEALAGSLVNLPGIMVFPGLLADGPFMRFARAVAAARGFPFRVTGAVRRRVLSGAIDPKAALTATERSIWQDNLDKWQSLQHMGRLSYRVARNPEEVGAMLDSLRTLSDADAHDDAVAAMVPVCRMLARRDWLRMHALFLDDVMIAVAIQPVIAGEATVWRVFERPDMVDKAVGEQLIVRLTEWNLRDANITLTRADSTAGPFLAERFWPKEEGRATLVTAIRPGLERVLDHVTGFYENTEA